MRRGPVGGVPLLILPALFEEMNRTRRLIALTTAMLARAGVRSWLPDLPGTGDHEDGPEAKDLPRWRAAMLALAGIAASGRPLHLLAVRGGALLADAVPGASLYRIAPQTGERALRDLWRARAATERETGGGATVATLDATSRGGAAVVAAGYRIESRFADQLRAAPLPAPAVPTRTAATAAAPGVDVVLGGPLVWRQAEPADEAALAHAIAADWLAWIATATKPADRP